MKRIVIMTEREIMKSHLLKKVLSIIIAFSCIAGIAIGTNATTVYLGANTTPSSSGSYSTYSTSIKSYKTYLGSVGFNGLPSGTWASGASIRIGFYNSSNTLMSQGLTTHNSLYTTSSKVNFFPSSGTSYRQGGFTNCSRACTAGATFTYYT